MNRAKIRFLQEFFITQMNYWALFPIALMILILTMGIGRLTLPFPTAFLIIGICAMSFLPLFFYWVRCRVNHFFVFFLIHAGVVAGSYLLPIPSAAVHIPCVLAALYFSLYSFYVRLGSDVLEDKHLSPVFTVIISGGCVFILQYMGFGGYRKIFCLLLILTFSFYFLIFYIEKYQHFLTVNESSASHIPEEKIFRTGLKLVLSYTLGGALILVAVSDLSWLDKILQFFKGILIAILKILFILFPPRAETPVAEEEVLEVDPISFALPEAEEKSFWLWDLLWYAICFVLAALLFYNVLKILVQLFRYLHGRFNANLAEIKVDEEEEEVDVIERLRSDRRKKKAERRFFGFLSANEKVRRLYRKQAFRLDDNVARLRRITARECADEMSAPAMGQIYEKARYSGASCSSEDVKLMKAACKKSIVPRERGGAERV